MADSVGPRDNEQDKRGNDECGHDQGREQNEPSQWAMARSTASSSSGESATEARPWSSSLT
jgi:hypothetical protein